MDISPRAIADKYKSHQLRDQFVICESESDCIAGWKRIDLAEYKISLDPVLPVEAIRDQNGQVVGQCIGQYLTADFEFGGPLRLRIGSEPERDIEDFVSGLSGHFVVLMCVGAVQRVYLDALGSRSAVYVPSRRIVAATPMLVSYDPGTEDNVELIRKVDLVRRNSSYPFEMTPRHGIRRLLPNHFLDLRTWSAVRHWPNHEHEPTGDITSTVAEIGEIVSRTIGVVAEHHAVQMSVTAGEDSRMLLACAGDSSNRVSSFTFALQDQFARRDCYMGPRIARAAGVPHRVLRGSRPTADQIELFLYRSGFCTADPRAIRAIPMVMQLDPERAYLPGIAGELARAYYWRAFRLRNEGRKADIDPAVMTGLENLPPDPEFLEAFRNWREAYPTDSGIAIADTYFIEQGIGCHSSPMCYGFAGMTKFELWPLNNRRVIDLIFSLPDEYRRSRELNKDIMRSRMPELMDYPFNWGGYWFESLNGIHLAKGRVKRAIRALTGAVRV